MTYLRDYNTSWQGCNIVNTVATSGNEAKKNAIAFVKRMLRVQDGKTNPEDTDYFVYGTNFRSGKEIEIIKDGH